MARCCKRPGIPQGWKCPPVANIAARAFATASAALVVTLPPGVYSFIAQGNAGGSGSVLVEVYDADERRRFARAELPLGSAG